MYGVELYAAVRLAVVDEGLSHHEAGRRFGIDRRTVKKMLSYPPPPGYRLKQFAPLARRLRVAEVSGRWRNVRAEPMAARDCFRVTELAEG